MDLGLGRRSHAIAAAAGLVAAVLVSLLLAASAAAEVRSGSASDPLESDKAPGEDIIAMSASYDTTGALNVAVTTAGPPLASSPLELVVGFGTLLGGECVRPLALIQSKYSQATASWSFGGAEGPAVKNVVGNTTGFSASAPILAGEGFDCAEPVIFEMSGGDLIPIEGLASPLVLSGPPAAEPPSSPPPSSPPPPTPPPPAPKLAKLSLPSAKPFTLRRGKWKKVKLKITNTGDATAAKVSLRLGKAKGVVVKPKAGKFELKSIAPGKSKSVSVKLKMTKKAKATSTLKLIVTGAKGVKTSGKLTLQVWRKRRGKAGGKGKGKEAPAAPLAEKLFYAYENHPSESADLIGYAFLDDTWAYHGIPSGGLPTCTEVTGNAEKDGCVKYSYDPKTRAVKIGSLAGGKILADGSLEIDGEKYAPTYIPPAGTRYQVEQEYGGYRGLCGLITGCSTWFENLLLTSGGEFVLTRRSTTTIGGPGPGETFIAVGNYPPDQHGTYEIEPRGRIRLSYADGSVKTMTIAILLDSAGKPDPVNEGLLLDDRYFNFLPD